MAAEIFTALSNLRMVLETETDADSPDNETTYGAIREAIECILMLAFDTGDSGSATSNPPDDSTGVLTDSGASYGVDDHNLRTLLITSGDAKGNFYTIDDTTATTIVCTGDNLYSDGVRSGDDYKVLFDLKANSDGHDHDGVNSRAPADATIIRSRLATATGDQSGSLNAGVYVTITLDSYCFSPNIYTEHEDVVVVGHTNDVNDQAARFGLHNTGGSQYDYQVRWRYVTATNNPFIYAIRDKKSGAYLHLWTSDDPPPEYWGLKEKPENFVPPIIVSDFDPALHEEIIIFDADKDMMAVINERSVVNAGKKLPCEMVSTEFDFDDEKKIFKPKNLVTI